MRQRHGGAVLAGCRGCALIVRSVFLIFDEACALVSKLQSQQAFNIMGFLKTPYGIMIGECWGGCDGFGVISFPWLE